MHPNFWTASWISRVNNEVCDALARQAVAEGQIFTRFSDSLGHKEVTLKRVL